MSEISGILKNGIDRGWQLSEIKQSLLNAGYSSQEIESEMSIFQAKPLLSQEQIQPEQKQGTQNLKNFQTPLVDQTKKMSPLAYVLIFILILLAVGIFLFIKL